MSLDVLIQAARYVDHEPSASRSAVENDSTSDKTSRTSNFVAKAKTKHSHVNGYRSHAPLSDTSMPDSRKSRPKKKITCEVTGNFLSAASSKHNSSRYDLQNEKPSSATSGQLNEPADSKQVKRKKTTCNSSSSSITRINGKNAVNGSQPSQSSWVPVENRSVHNVLEKNRRAHLKDCFEALKQEVMESDDEKKASHLAVLKNAVHCIQQLQRQSEALQKETDRFLREKSQTQEELQSLKREFCASNPNVNDLALLAGIDGVGECEMPVVEMEDDRDSQATCTAPGSPAPDAGFEESNEHLDSTQKPTLSHSHSPHGSSSYQSPESSRTPYDRPAKKDLPIKLRILQDQQEGLFREGHDYGKFRPRPRSLSPITPPSCATPTVLTPSSENLVSAKSISGPGLYGECGSTDLLHSNLLPGNHIAYWPAVVTTGASNIAGYSQMSLPGSAYPATVNGSVFPFAPFFLSASHQLSPMIVLSTPPTPLEDQPASVSASATGHTQGRTFQSSSTNSVAFSASRVKMTSQAHAQGQDDALCKSENIRHASPY